MAHERICRLNIEGKVYIVRQEQLGMSCNIPGAERLQTDIQWTHVIVPRLMLMLCSGVLGVMIMNAVSESC